MNKSVPLTALVACLLPLGGVQAQADLNALLQGSYRIKASSHPQA